MRAVAVIAATVLGAAAVGALAQGDALIEESGSGPAVLAPFQVGGAWELHWEVEGERLHVEVADEDGEVLGTALTRDEPGSGVERHEVSGRLQLHVEAEGAWSLRVVPVGDEPAGAASSGGSEDGIVSQVEIFRVDLEQEGARERFTPVSEALPGEVVEYRLSVRNESSESHGAGRVVVSVPIPDEVAYVPDSAGPPDEERVLIEFSGDGGRSFQAPPVLTGADGARSTVPPEEYDHVRWTLVVPLEPGAEETLFYRVRVR